VKGAGDEEKMTPVTDGGYIHHALYHRQTHDVQEQSKSSRSTNGHDERKVESEERSLSGASMGRKDGLNLFHVEVEETGQSRSRSHTPLSMSIEHSPAGTDDVSRSNSKYSYYSDSDEEDLEDFEGVRADGDMTPVDFSSSACSSSSSAPSHIHDVNGTKRGRKHARRVGRHSRRHSPASVIAEIASTSGRGLSEYCFDDVLVENRNHECSQDISNTSNLENITEHTNDRPGVTTTPDQGVVVAEEPVSQGVGLSPSLHRLRRGGVRQSKTSSKSAGNRSNPDVDQGRQAGNRESSTVRFRRAVLALLESSITFRPSVRRVSVIDRIVSP